MQINDANIFAFWKYPSFSGNGVCVGGGGVILLLFFKDVGLNAQIIVVS